jgi:hypothetical protein
MVQPTVRQAATAAGISTATATKWLRDASFCRAYDDARRQALGETLHYLQQSMHAAVAKLVTLLTDPASKPVVQLAAARAILEYGLRAVELEEVQTRIAQLQKQLEYIQGAR